MGGELKVKGKGAEMVGLLKPWTTYFSRSQVDLL